MKKNLFIVLAVAGALASCSNDETLQVVQHQPQAIGFSSYVDKATRAETTLKYLKNTDQGFNVWGQVSSTSSGSSAILTKELVTWVDGTPGKWTYSNTRYWQASSDYAFTAIGPKNAAGVTYNESQGASFKDNLHGTIGMDISTGYADVDVVYDMQTSTTNEDLSKGTGVVPFTFNHILSKVRVIFKNGFSSSGQNLKFTDVKITSKKSGSLTLTGVTNTSSSPYSLNNFNWSIDGDGTYTKTYESLLTEGITKDETIISDALNAQSCIEKGKKGATDACYLIPTQTSLDIEFTVQLYSGTQEGNTYAHTGSAKATATIPDGGLKPGYSYILTATIDASNIDPSGSGPKSITFTVSDVNGWTDADGITVTVPSSAS